MNGNDTNTGDKNMNGTAAAYFAELDLRIADLEAALAQCGNDDDLNDPSELRAEIDRLRRLKD